MPGFSAGRDRGLVNPISEKDRKDRKMDEKWWRALRIWVFHIFQIPSSWLTRNLGGYVRKNQDCTRIGKIDKHVCFEPSYIYIYMCYMYIYIYYYMCLIHIIYIWVNYNISPTWIKAIWGWFPLLTMIPVRSQWGRYKLPRSVAMAGSISKGLRNLGWEIRGCSDWETPECPTVWKHLRKSHSDRLFLAQAMGNPKDGNSSIHRSGNK